MRKRSIVAVGLAAALALSCAGCAQQGSPAQEAASEPVVVLPEGMYVDTAWLKDNLKDVVVVDARAAADFAKQHIPGAVNLHWTSISNQTVAQGEEGWAELLDGTEMAALVSALGIDGTKPVVVYADPQAGWGEDGRIYWTLRESGIENVSILDGGWPKWLSDAADQTATLEAEDHDPLTQVDTAYVKEHLESAVLVDARGEDEYTGEINMGEARMGRIPGAVNVPVLSLLNDDATIKSDEDLEKVFEGAGLKPSDEIIVYCTGGVRAAYVAEALLNQGYGNVSVYTASFSEWAGDPENEVEI